MFACAAFQGCAHSIGAGLRASTTEQFTQERFQNDARHHGESDHIFLYPPADEPIQRGIFWIAFIAALLGFVGMGYQIIRIETSGYVSRGLFRKIHTSARNYLMVSLLALVAMVMVSWPAALFLGLLQVILYKKTQEAFNQ